MNESLFLLLYCMSILVSPAEPFKELQKTRRVHHVDGLIATSGYLKQSIARGNPRIRCGVICDVMQGCRSYFVDLTTSVCQLHSSVLDNVTGMAESESTFYFRKTTECPEEWIRFRDSCYFIDSSITVSYEDAKVFCRSKGAGLPIVEDEAKNDFLITLGQYLPPNSIGLWIGLTDIEQQGTYVWEYTGGAPSFTDWDASTGEPHLNDERCVVMLKSYSYKWHDIPCSTPITAVCEM